jgi:serine/threonine protein kinase
MKGIEGLTLGRYELRRRLAQGGMAEVYLAYDRRVKRQVAIKVLYGRDESFIRRFEREARAVGAFSHDHILPLYDFGEQRPWYYLVMPYISGGTLRDYLLKRKRFTLHEAASFTEQIASALQYAHDHGVIHRDVKPSNILLRRDGFAYLVDFGLAKAMLGAESLTGAGAMIGTPEYMAPEQSNGINDYRSDIYSLGVILYQMLTGRVPFTAESPVATSLKHIQHEPPPPRSFNSEIPVAVEAVILKALAKAPDERYQEVQALSLAYWQALHNEQLGTTTEEESPSSTPVTIDSEAADEAQPEQATPSATTIILPETEGELLGRPPAPQLFPLVGKSTPSHPPPSSHVRAKHSRRGPVVLALSCLFALMLALSLGLLWQTSSTISGKPQRKAQSLDAQQSVSGLTATSIVQAQQVQATLAAQSRVQATAGITSSLGAGTILYEDTLTSRNGDAPNSTSGGWVDDGSQCSFRSGSYHVQTYTAHTAAWCYSNQQQFSNAVITAQAQLVRGDTYGLIFRLNPVSRDFYVFEINSKGEYRFVRASGPDPSQWLTLIDWTRSNAILSGYGKTNTFLILASGYQFRFYMNQQLIITNFTDTTYTSGLIGLFVGGDSPGGTEAAFNNIYIFEK